MEIKTPSVEEGGNHITHYKGFILHKTKKEGGGGMVQCKKFFQKLTVLYIQFYYINRVQSCFIY